jgi:predicted choloylglycine hydrolase
MQRPELLIPAGNLEKMRTAVLYGADAVYVGIEGLSLRAAQAEFSLADLVQGIHEAHRAGVRVYGAINTFARNSDFLVSIEKLYMNCLYSLDNAYAFNGNTTAYVEMEDGVNEHGLAAGLCFVYPKVNKPGFNAGMLIRYILEKCKTTGDAITALKSLPIASSQTITLADASGDIAVIECNAEKLVIIRPESGRNFVAAANCFVSNEMQPYRNTEIDDWRADDRYQTAHDAMANNPKKLSVEFAEDILAGRYGFMCQYDRKTNADTVWSVVYDLKRKQTWRTEGNPSRKAFIEDARMKLTGGNDHSKC